MHTLEDEPAPGPTFKSARGDRRNNIFVIDDTNIPIGTYEETYPKVWMNNVKLLYIYIYMYILIDIRMYLYTCRKINN